MAVVDPNDANRLSPSINCYFLWCGVAVFRLDREAAAVISAFAGMA